MERSLQDRSQHQIPPRQVEWTGVLTHNNLQWQLALPELLANMTLRFTLDWPPPFDLHHHEAAQQASHSVHPLPAAIQTVSEVHQPHARGSDEHVKVFGWPLPHPIEPPVQTRLGPGQVQQRTPRDQSLLNFFKV